MKKENLTQSQLIIMKCIWDKGEDISYQELTHMLAARFGKTYQRTTLITFLQQMADKGYVTTHRNGRFAYVHAEITEDEFKKKHVREEIDFWFKGQVSDFFSAFVEGGGIPKEEREKIRCILDELGD